MTPQALRAHHRNGDRVSLTRLEPRYWNAVHRELSKRGWFHGMNLYQRTHSHDDVVALIEETKFPPVGPRALKVPTTCA